MAGNRKALPQDRDVMVQDFQLVQALHEARALAHEHGDAAGWAELHDQLDHVLERLGTDAPSPAGPPAVGIERIDRPSFAIDAATAGTATSSLMALANQPDDAHLDLARRAVTDLEDALG